VFVFVALIALLLSAAKRFYDWNRQLGSEYETAAVISEVAQFVESNQGQWPRSWNDLPGGSREPDVAMNFNVTVDDLISDPKLIYRVITPRSGYYRTFPHADRQLYYLREKMLKMHSEQELKVNGVR
jgi:hypothetical protein